MHAHIVSYPPTARAIARGALVASVACLLWLTPCPVLAQAPLPSTSPPTQGAAGAPPSLSPAELERIVSPIALHPDPLLAHILTAATYPTDIPAAARWADDHHYLTGKRLADAIAADQLPWDPSVQALLPFPSVLEMMASDMPWTEELGNAFLAEPDAVMDAVQRMRQRASGYGYLRGCAPVVVHDGPFVEILPADPDYMVVPYYDPGVVFLPPPPGFVAPRGVYCGFGIHLGVWFEPWGWRTTRFLWPSHGVIINNAPWGRRWTNRVPYAHPYAVPRHETPRPPDRHVAKPRTPSDRNRERPRGDGGHARRK